MTELLQQLVRDALHQREEAVPAQLNDLHENCRLNLHQRAKGEREFREHDIPLWRSNLRVA